MRVWGQEIEGVLVMFYSLWFASIPSPHTHTPQLGYCTLAVSHISREKESRVGGGGTKAAILIATQAENGLHRS